MQSCLSLLPLRHVFFAEEVDIFDGGPTFRSATAEIRSVRESREAPLAGLRVEPSGTPHLIGNAQLRGFRVCLGEVRVEAEGVSLNRDVAFALGVRLGDPIRWVEARAQSKSSSPA